MSEITGYIYNASIYGTTASFVFPVTPALGTVKEASLGTDFVWLNGLLDVSMTSGYSTEYIDGSLNLRIKEASLGTAFVWNTGLLDVSIVSGYSTTYIDGSLNLKVNLTGDTMTGNLSVPVVLLSSNRLDAPSAIDISIAGGIKYGCATTMFHMVGGTTGYWGLMYEAATATNPNIVPNKASLDTGIGAAATGALSLIAGGVEVERLTSTGVSITGNVSIGGVLTMPDTWSLSSYVNTSSYYDGSINDVRATFGTKNSSANGFQNQIAYDASYFYVCTSTNIWGRVLLQNNY